MTKVLHLNDAKGYATEANLMKALAKTGLDNWEMASRIIVCRKADGKWTAIFVIDRRMGGYIMLASQYGFFSV